MVIHGSLAEGIHLQRLSQMLDFFVVSATIEETDEVGFFLIP